MLTFTQGQINRLQTSWRIEQLQAQRPAVLAELAARYPAFYAKSKARQHRSHASKRIEQAVVLGYTEIEQIQQLLDMEYRAQMTIFEQNSIQPLYQAAWLQPWDRIDCIQYHVALKCHKERNCINAYQLLDHYSRQQRYQDIAQ